MKTTRRRFLVSLLALVSFAATLATTHAVTFSLAGDFTSAENNAESVWSFRLDDYANNPPTFLPLLDDSSRDANQLWGTSFPNPPVMWSEGGGYWGIGKNTSDVEQSASDVTWAPGEVLLHPKGGASPARLVICWKAPRSMVVNVHTSLRKAMPCGNGVGYELRTRIGGVDTEIIGFGAGNIGSGIARDHTGLSFGGGDELFLRVDTWGDAGCDITGVAMEIAEVVGPPVISADPTGGTVAEGCTLTLTATAANATGYAWYKGTDLIPGAGSATYSIIDAKPADAGTYRLVAMNSSQSVTSAPAVVAVTARPTYATELLTEDFNAYTGNQNNLQYQTGLKVAFGGNVPQWNKAGAGAIHAVDRTGTGGYAVMIWQDNVITLANAIPANEAGETYHVDFVANTATYSEGTQATTDTDGMVIDLLRGDDTVLQSFTCQPGAWAGTANFAPFSFAYTGDGSGDVRVRVSPLAASGHFGGAIDHLRVATDYVRATPPTITSPPVGGAVAEGCNFVFTVSGSGANSYAWYRNGDPIPGATGLSYSIVNAKTSDAGSYTVVLSNPAGSVTSAGVVLTVTAITPHPTVLLTEDFSAYTGNQNTVQHQTGLPVSFGGNLPAWNKLGGGAIHAVARTGQHDYAVMIWQDNVLTLANAIPANEAGATYHVDLVANPATYAEGSQATTDTDGMLIDLLRSDDTVLQSFTCQPGAWTGTATFAPFSFAYTGDGSGDVRVRISPLAASGHFGGAIDNLRVATDWVPSSPPEITAQPSGDTVMEGSDVSFSVTASGLPSYQWAKGGTPIPGATNSTYSISDVRPGDAGSYTVTAKNASGSVTSVPAILNVTPAPTYATYAEAVISDNPIHYYPLDETSGTTAADLGSLAITGGTYSGGFTLDQPPASPALGKAIQLDGASGSLVDLGSFHPGDAVTAEAWFMVDPSARVPWNAVVGRWDGSYEIANHSDLGVSFAVRNDANTLGQVWSATPPRRGVWHHVAGVFSGGTLTIYVDGIRGGTQTIGGVLQNAGPTPDRAMIGATRDGTGGAAFNLKGWIDEVAVYDTALSVAQIRSHHRAAQFASQSLTIQRQDMGSVIVSWPSFSPGYVLQTAASVAGPFADYPGNINVQGNNFTAQVPIDSATRFFRLLQR